MGIYIPGIDMPDSCDNCFICNRCEGNCDISDADYLPNKRPDDCPLIELPPHGRLGDLDALFLAMFQCTDGSIIGDKDIDGWPHEARYADIKRFIRQAPTIIPAEGGEQHG